MRSKKNNLSILILDQGRQALPFFKSLRKEGHDVICICNSRLSETYFSRYPTEKLLWPSYVKDYSGFESALISFLKTNEIDVTISVGDISSEILSKNKEEIQKYTHITSPDYDIFLKAANKLQLMKYCLENDLPCPKTYNLTEGTYKNIPDILQYPVIVKPTRGVGAIGLTKISDQNELLNKFSSLKTKYGDLIIQEYIPQEGGMQYQAEAFLDENSKMKVCMVIEKPRFFPVNGGTSTANVTINHPIIENCTKKLLEGLGWKGPADVDYILDPRDGIPKILEINPRVTAGIKIGFVAGINFADLHVKLALGDQIPEIKDYKLGIYCRNFLLEILWLIFSDRRMRRNTYPPYFKLYGKNMVDQVFSLDDPFTGLGFFLNTVRKYFNYSKLKAKFHL